jgi:hypothetical protein
MQHNIPLGIVSAQAAAYLLEQSLCSTVLHTCRAHLPSRVIARLGLIRFGVS